MADLTIYQRLVAQLFLNSFTMLSKRYNLIKIIMTKLMVPNKKVGSTVDYEIVESQKVIRVNCCELRGKILNNV